MLVDTHAHLVEKFYQNDLEEVLANNSAIKVNIVGFNLESSFEAVRNAHRYANYYASVGLHPNDVSASKANNLKQIETLLSDEKVIALGEIGLDYYHTSSPKEMQMEFFAKQIKIARKFNYPYIVHSRKAFEDTISVIQQSGYLNCVFHSFDYGKEEIIKILDLGCYVSFSGMLTFRARDDLREASKNVPLNMLFFETDSPFLAPVPNRGKRNQPLNVEFVYEQFAQISGFELSVLEEAVLFNFSRFFKKAK